jgi:hypothetical protein
MQFPSFSASIAAQCTYGIELTTRDHWFVQQQERNFEFLTLGSTPFRWLVDVVPMLRYVPAWVPGAEFQRVAQAARSCWQVMLDMPFSHVQASMVGGYFTGHYALTATAVHRPMGPRR